MMMGLSAEIFPLLLLQVFRETEKCLFLMDRRCSRGVSLCFYARLKRSLFYENYVLEQIGFHLSWTHERDVDVDV